jgi:hypothetical protein
MDNEEISDVLSASHHQPILPSWMLIHEFAEIVELVLDDPITGSIAAPQLAVPGLLLLKPDGSVALQPSCWQTFSILFGRDYLHS